MKPGEETVEKAREYQSCAIETQSTVEFNSKAKDNRSENNRKSYACIRTIALKHGTEALSS